MSQDKQYNSKVSTTEMQVVEGNWNSNSTTIEASKIKIECNQNASSDSQNLENLLDGSIHTCWCTEFKPKETSIKMTLKDPVDLVGYTLVLANDHPDRDPIEWRVRAKENGTNNIYEETHKI